MIGSFFRKNLKKIVSCIVLGTIGMSILPVESVQALTRDGDKEKIISQYIIRGENATRTN